MKLFHLYPEGGPAPPMTSSICVFHLGISLGYTTTSAISEGPRLVSVKGSSREESS